MIHRLLIAVLAWLAFAAGPVLAQEFTSQDRAAVQVRIDRLDQIISSGDLAGALEVVPPRLTRAIADRYGMTQDQLLTTMREVIRTQLQGVIFVDYQMDLAATLPVLTPDGSRTYLLIPTTTVMEIQGAGRVRSRNGTLALKDGGEWYLIRVDEAAQVALIRELWPEFAAVDFPAGTMEAAE